MSHTRIRFAIRPGVRFLGVAFLIFVCARANAFVDRVFDDGFQQRVTFQIQSPAIPIAAGDTQTYCYFFTMPNNVATGVKWWVSHMDAGMQHAILFSTPTAAASNGTLTNGSPCATFPGQVSTWLYATHNTDEDLVFPVSDGAGHPIALSVAAGQPAFLQMLLVNDTSGMLSPSITITAEGLDPAQTYTTTGAYMTINTSIDIPPGSNGFEAQNTCPAPSGARFWWLSTRTHKFGVESKVSDGSTALVDTTDWGHPAITQYSEPTLYQFTNGITVACTYDNPTNSSIQFGDSESTNEVCMGIGYFTPAPTGGKICVNSTGPQ